MGLDAETVALSPFGPSQSGRFYGVNNLLETMLLMPALVGAALLGRAGVVVARVRVRDDRRRPLRRGRRRDRRARCRLPRAAPPPPGPPADRATGAAVAAGSCRAGAGLLLAVDAATGGSSHVTDAVGDGPFALAGDIADRLEWSVRRTAAGLGATVVVLGSLATLVSWLSAPAGTPCSTRSSSALRSRSWSTTRRATCSGWAQRSRSRLPGPRLCGRVKLSVDAPRRHLLALLALIALPVGRCRLRRRRGGQRRSRDRRGQRFRRRTTEATTTEGSPARR